MIDLRCSTRSAARWMPPIRVSFARAISASSASVVSFLCRPCPHAERREPKTHSPRNVFVQGDRAPRVLGGPCVRLRCAFEHASQSVAEFLAQPQGLGHCWHTDGSPRQRPQLRDTPYCERIERDRRQASGCPPIGQIGGDHERWPVDTGAIVRRLGSAGEES
jgi:hypothetical protein